MTEKQFQVFCKFIYWITVAILALQILICVMMFWMSWHGLLGHQDVMMLLGASVFASLVTLWGKISFFKREEVSMGTSGPFGITHSMGANIFWWCGYFFLELVLLVPAIKIYVQEISF